MGDISDLFGIADICLLACIKAKMFASYHRFQLN